MVLIIYTTHRRHCQLALVPDQECLKYSLNSTNVNDVELVDAVDCVTR